MKKVFNFIWLLPLIFVVNGCSFQGDAESSIQRYSDLSTIQFKLRESALNRWGMDLPNYSSAIEGSQSESTFENSSQVSNDPLSVTFRNQLKDDWAELGSTKELSGDRLCEFWFQGWFGLGDTFAKDFAVARGELNAMGLKIETLENIKMIQDNRNTINYPAEGEKENLFVCEATTVFRVVRGGVTEPNRSLISFYYYLNNGSVKSNFMTKIGVS